MQLCAAVIKVSRGRGKNSCEFGVLLELSVGIVTFFFLFKTQIWTLGYDRSVGEWMMWCR